MSSSTSSPLTFDPSLDFQSLARTLNFNLPFKLDKTNYVNWKAQLHNAAKDFIRIGMAIAINHFLSNLHSLINLKLS
ncbi:hypothetical protein ACOSP7_015011 [Xanthoceras sorbifolium]